TSPDVSAEVDRSEREAQSDGRIDQVSVQVAVGESVLYARPHGSAVGIEALGEVIVERHGYRVEVSAALAAHDGRAARIGTGRVGVLFLAVIGDRCRELR